MKLVRGMALAVLAFVLMGCAGQLSLVGFDKYGNAISEGVNQDKYEENLAIGLIAVQDSVIPALDKQEAQNLEWSLRTAVIGFALKIGVGFGPFQLGVKPRFRAAFANGENPPIP
ncbi:MAG: hypothetical protein HYR96_09540 [Deltaproteobacteria bacterium]|nr:hypothetical protein [Deltaproteobacteria bacterium]